MQESISTTELNLKQVRQLCGLTIRDVAKLLKITGQAYQYKEVGLRGFKDHEIEKLSDIFKLDISIMVRIINNRTFNKFEVI